MELPMCEKEKDFKKIWSHSNSKSNETVYDSDGVSVMPDSNSDLFDLTIENGSYYDDSKENLQYSVASMLKLQKLKVVSLEPISISSTASHATPIVNLKQSFNFPCSVKPSKEISTQTSQLDLINRSLDSSSELKLRQRPSSLPPENAALINLGKRVQSDATTELIGDGSKIGSRKITENEAKMPDLEVSDCIPMLSQNMKPKSGRQTAKLIVKKFNRPNTRYPRKRPTSQRPDTVVSEIDDQQMTCKVQPASRKTKKGKETLCKKPENLLNFEVSSDISTDGGMYEGGNHHTKLCNIIDKLQDHEWEVCMAGLRELILFAGSVNWESELGQKFIPIISRKLIDHFKSPRSNLCRTACQTAGEFFLVAKSTKRPEFDEMVDILMCKTSDSNRFIQKDACVALDKMALSICVHHSVRAVCSKGPDHKNSVVRATTARLLYHICKNAGIEQIIGSDANPRTRKRVLSNLAKFLMDKNVDTRRHAERLCKMLKHHKFFMEYFFKDIENNYKNPLRKILNSLDSK